MRQILVWVGWNKFKKELKSNSWNFKSGLSIFYQRRNTSTSPFKKQRKTKSNCISIRIFYRKGSEKERTIERSFRISRTLSIAGRTRIFQRKKITKSIFHNIHRLWRRRTNFPKGVIGIVRRRQKKRKESSEEETNVETVQKSQYYEIKKDKQTGLSTVIAR